MLPVDIDHQNHFQAPSSCVFLWDVRGEDFLAANRIKNNCGRSTEAVFFKFRRHNRSFCVDWNVVDLFLPSCWHFAYWCQQVCIVILTSLMFFFFRIWLSFFPSWIHLHPPTKTDMEPENSPLKRAKHWPKHQHFFGFHSKVFWGVHPKDLTSSCWWLKSG